MRKVFKYSVTALPTPIKGFNKIVHFGYQRGVPFFWAEVDTSSTQVSRVSTLVCGTGWGIVEPIFNHYGSVQEGEFVWHLYWEAKNE